MQDRTDYQLVEQDYLCCASHNRTSSLPVGSVLSDSHTVASRALDQPKPLDIKVQSFSMLLRSERPPAAILSTILVAAVSTVRTVESPLMFHAII
jgi:hypothetical protein